jgi:hypothetical protein
MLYRRPADALAFFITAVPQDAANAWMGVGALGWMACLFQISKTPTF